MITGAQEINWIITEAAQVGYMMVSSPFEMDDDRAQ